MLRHSHDLPSTTRLRSPVLPGALGALAILCTLGTTLGAAGCSFDQGAPPPARLSQRLLAPTPFDVQTSSDVRLSAHDGNGQAIDCAPPHVLGGAGTLHSTISGLILVNELALDLSDVQIAPGVFFNPDRRTLTGVSVKLGAPFDVTTTWSEDGLTAHGTGRTDLLLDWSLVDDTTGRPLPLATQRLRDVVFDVDVTTPEEGGMEATLKTEVTGPILDFSVVTLSDLGLTVRARAETP